MDGHGPHVASITSTLLGMSAHTQVPLGVLLHEPHSEVHHQQREVAICAREQLGSPQLARDLAGLHPQKSGIISGLKHGASGATGDKKQE
eukprot:501896-Alexandrium_andersonii.AAC.1